MAVPYTKKPQTPSPSVGKETLMDERNFSTLSFMSISYTSQPSRKQEIKKSYDQALAFLLVLNHYKMMNSKHRQERKRTLRKGKTSGIQVHDLMFETFWT